MASAPKKKKVDQSMLRDMMKREQSKLSQQKQQQKKIDSPFAKYNSTGQLLCSLCQCPVKMDRLWVAHVSGRTHKQKVEELKRLQQNVNQRAGSGAGDSGTSGQKKRKLSSSEKAGEVRLAHLAQYDDDDSDGESAVTETVQSDKSDAGSALPADFFDSGEKVAEPASESTEASEEEAPERKSMADKLPEGFFDNPMKDAKVREVKYVDAEEEEWEKFQKVIAEESTVSEHLLEEDDETTNVSRQLSEIDEQIKYWSRIHSLEERQEEIHQGISGRDAARGREEGVKQGAGEEAGVKVKDEPMETGEQSDVDEDIDESELDALDNWKWKGMKG